MIEALKQLTGELSVLAPFVVLAFVGWAAEEWARKHPKQNTRP